MIESGVRVMVVEATYGDAAPGLRRREGHPARPRPGLLGLLDQGVPLQHRHPAPAARLEGGRPVRRRHPLQAPRLGGRGGLRVPAPPRLQPWSTATTSAPRASSWRCIFVLPPVGEGARVRPDTTAMGPYRFAHPGFAWVYTRDALEKLGGLIETAVLGAADHHQALALVGMAKDSLPGRADRRLCEADLPMGGALQPAHRREHRLRAWDHRARLPRPEGGSRLRLALGHPQAPRLRPNHRPEAQHLGVWELAGNKPSLRRDILGYFKSRNEDHTTIRAERMREAADPRIGRPTTAAIRSRPVPAREGGHGCPGPT